MLNRFNVVVEQGFDGNLVSEVIELPGCHTQAKTYDKLMRRTKEAISLYLEVQNEPQKMIKFVGLQQVEV